MLGAQNGGQKLWCERTLETGVFKGLVALLLKFAIGCIELTFADSQLHTGRGELC